MMIVASQTGIDVHKRDLWVSRDGKPAFKVLNQEAEAREFVAGLPESCIVHLESSGGYERLICRLLDEAGIEVRRHNPLKVRRLAQALGSAAKTDPVDARGLSGTGALLSICLKKSTERQRLADFSRAIESLKRTISENKKRLKMPELDEDAAKAYSEVIALLKTKLAQFERRFAARARASSFAEQYELMLSLPDTGPVTSRICLCELPEDWESRTGAQICSYAALAPVDDSSGTRIGTARIGSGNSRLKAAFYMPALCAIRRQQWARDLYARLRAKGRTHRHAIVAVMRRLLVRLVAVIQRGSPWQDEPPAHRDPGNTAGA